MLQSPLLNADGLSSSVALDNAGESEAAAAARATASFACVVAQSSPVPRGTQRRLPPAPAALAVLSETDTDRNIDSKVGGEGSGSAECSDPGSDCLCGSYNSDPAPELDVAVPAGMGSRARSCFPALLALGLLLLCCALASLPDFPPNPLTATWHPRQAHPPTYPSTTPDSSREDDSAPEAVDAVHGAVASDERHCSAVGRDILQRMGGNAVDAAVATVLCNGVLNPVASGIGGGAFMLIRMNRPNGSIVEFIDSRETAPSAASSDMFNGREMNITTGPLSIAVPGELKGLHSAWQRHGSLPWRSLLAPAVQLAGGGFPVSPYLAQWILTSNATILSDPGLRSVFAPQGRLLREGETCVRASLAETLRQVAEQGPGVLYGGALGKQVVEEVRAQGGVLSVKDLETYEADIGPGVESDVFGFRILTVPPPSGGGASIVEVLKILEGFRLPLASEGPLGVHRMVEALKHSSALRTELGDPRFVNTSGTVRDMLSSDFAHRLRCSIDDDATFPPEYYGRPAAGGERASHPLYASLDDHGTSHTCVIDRERNAVSVTSTVNGPWGAGILSPSTGILLNNEMADFGLPSPNRSQFSPPPSPANFIRPGKRPLSSMAPSIVLQKGQLRAVLGGSGGPFIISSVVQVFLNYFLKGMSPLKAVTAPRVHHQLLPNVLLYESNHSVIHGVPISLDQKTLDALEHRGHTLMPLSFAGVSQLIVQDLENPVDSLAGRGVGLAQRGVHSVGKKQGAGRSLPEGGGSASLAGAEQVFGLLTAVSDPRKDGAPAGY